MTPLNLLETLQQRGATVTVEGEKLYIKPPGVSRDLALEIRDHKPALLQLLAGGGQQIATKDDNASCAHAREAASGVLNFDAGAAFRDYQASGPHAPVEELPPGVMPDGEVLRLNGAGLWIRPDGFIKVTYGTIPAVVTHCAKKQRAKMAAKQELAA
jgi:hypothetical protein